MPFDFHRARFCERRITHGNLLIASKPTGTAQFRKTERFLAHISEEASELKAKATN